MVARWQHLHLLPRHQVAEAYRALGLMIRGRPQDDNWKAIDGVPVEASRRHHDRHLARARMGPLLQGLLPEGRRQAAVSARPLGVEADEGEEDDEGEGHDDDEDTAASVDLEVLVIEVAVVPEGRVAGVWRSHR